MPTTVFLLLHFLFIWWITQSFWKSCRVTIQIFLLLLEGTIQFARQIIILSLIIRIELVRNFKTYNIFKNTAPIITTTIQMLLFLLHARWELLMILSKILIFIHSPVLLEPFLGSRHDTNHLRSQNGKKWTKVGRDQTCSYDHVLTEFTSGRT